MAPGGRDRKRIEVVQEFEVQNVRGFQGLVWGRRGRRPHREAQNDDAEFEVEHEPPICTARHAVRNAEADREVQQLTQRMREMELVIAKFQDMRPPKFFGNEGGEKATTWLKSMNYLFNLVQYTPELRLKLAVYQLKDLAQLWWEATEKALKESGQIISWEIFHTHFIEEYSPMAEDSPPSCYNTKEAEFNQLVQKNMSVEEYASQFSALLAYVPRVTHSDRSKLSRFMQGLNRTIHTLVMTGAPTTYAEAVEKAKNIEASLKGGSQPVSSIISQGSGSNVHMAVGIPPYQPAQSYQPSKQQKFTKRGKQLNGGGSVGSCSSSSSSGSHRGGGSVGSPGGIFCDRCGGKHFSAQCSGVQGSCYVCGQFGHYARVCPNVGRHQFQQPQFGRGFRGPAARPFVPAQSYQQSNYPQPRCFTQQHFPVPQQAPLHALKNDAEFLEDESTKIFARKVADHYSARTNQTLEEREASPIIHLKKLNNWIKSVLIQLYTKKGDAVLDLACGKGVDLIKWDKAGIGYYVGIDIADGLIEDCRTQYNGDADHQQRRKKFSFPAKLLSGDCYEVQLDKVLADDAPFDICSCQFALHYSWSTEARARRALANISALLRPGGIFMGTMPDANVIVKKLREADGLAFGNSVYWIRFDEEFGNKKFKSSSPFGIKYKFHLEDAVDCPEWIVPFNVFKSLAEEYGFEMVFVKNSHAFVDEYLKIPEYIELMRRLGALGDGKEDQSTLSPDEWEVAYLYSAFVLRKQGQPGHTRTTSGRRDKGKMHMLKQDIMHINDEV